MSLTLPDDVIRRLVQARRVVALTGGGVAAESGIPSFREAHTGHWAQYDVSELATPQAFVRNPRLVWEWYAYRRALAERAQPGASHYALVDLEQYYPEFTLITQSIDGLHWRAGSRDLIELNGSLRRCRCYESGHLAFAWDDDGEIPPRCARTAAVCCDRTWSCLARDCRTTSCAARGKPSNGVMSSSVSGRSALSSRSRRSHSWRVATAHLL